MSNVNEMNGFLVVGDPSLIVSKVVSAPYAPLFAEAFGAAALSGPPSQIFEFVCEAVAAFEESHAVSPFNSKYDAVLAGKAQFAASELSGLQLFTSSAKCVFCHTMPAYPNPANPKTGPDLFTNSAYFNVGTPKNPDNPFYKETNAKTNPLGYNPLGAAYIDYGLGDFLYPNLGLPAGNVGLGSNGKGDYLAVNGTFKTPTLRNVDKRHDPTFVKAYGHNGYFKSLAEFVHFYNTRNLTTVSGEVIDFTASNPYAKLRGTPLWPEPEYASPTTMVNPKGVLGGIGNLGLTAPQESDLVAFLQTLSDGF
jgi:cytochrome c peroxidase